MGYSPFDGVLLEDARLAIPGARAVLLHLEVERKLARRHGRPALDLRGVRDRAQACRELMAHGLLAPQLKALLPLGSPREVRSLASLAEHLTAYLEAVEASGHVEPDVALWAAASATEERSFWVERDAADGPLIAGLQDLQPARLRLLVTRPEVGPVCFRLSTRKGDGQGGLFGASLGLVEWFLEGLEAHGEGFANPPQLTHPEGWAEHSAWAPALERLFEGPLVLGDAASQLQRALVDSPLEGFRHAVEQVCAWVAQGIPSAEITLVHPAPETAALLLEPLLAEEGLALQVRGGLRPLALSASWAPLWALLEGLAEEDPCRMAAGLRASGRSELVAWAEALALADQTGAQGFGDALLPLSEAQRERAEATWAELQSLRSLRLPASAWAERLGRLATALRLPLVSDAFYGPLALLNEAWGDASWGFTEAQEALQLFLETATDPELSRPPEGIRLLGPGALLADWTGCRASLVLDLSEGAWPSAPQANPDLDWERKANLNGALLRLTQEGLGDPGFPPAMQRFWMPRSEHGEILPRALQRDAYAFNTLLALTREHFVALSPAQDAEGQPLPQGPFWHALEGAGTWQPNPLHPASALRGHWEVATQDPLLWARASASQPLPTEEALAVSAPPADWVGDARAAWLKGREVASATALEKLATCPFRSLAERVWSLSAFDAAGVLAMARGTLVHTLLEAVLRPAVGSPDWPTALRAVWGLSPEREELELASLIERLWAEHERAWLAEHAQEVPLEGLDRLAQEVRALIPNLAQYLALDLGAEGPTKFEISYLYPDCFPIAEARDSRVRKLPLAGGWSRELLGLELELMPLEMRVGAQLLKLGGKVDRLEQWRHEEHGAFLRVVDYKTAKKGYLSGFEEPEAPFSTHLQLPLYALLAEAQYALPVTSVLVPLKEAKPVPWDRQMAVLAASEAEGRPWRERLQAVLGGLSERLDRGDFPPTPGAHCAYCQLAALCGRPVDVDTDPETGAEA